MNIKHDIDPADWYDEQTKKDLIVIHGTAGLGYPGIDTTLDKADKINVHYVILRDGTVIQRIPESAWAYHTGDRASSMRSIGIECECWVTAQKTGKKYFTLGYAKKREIPAAEIIELKPFRGVRHFHLLTPIQKAALHELIGILQRRYGIPNIWHREVNSLPTAQKKGVITHAVISEKRLDFPPDYPLAIG